MANKKNSPRVERVYNDDAIKTTESTNVDDSFVMSENKKEGRDSLDNYSAFSSDDNNAVILKNDTTKKQKIKKVHKRVRSAKY